MINSETSYKHIMEKEQEEKEEKRLKDMEEAISALTSKIIYLEKCLNGNRPCS